MLRCVVVVLQSNPENTVGILTMAGRGVRVLVTPTSDLGKILACMHGRIFLLIFHSNLLFFVRVMLCFVLLLHNSHTIRLNNVKYK